MDEDHRYIIEPADDWTIYSHAWSNAMQHHYWYNESPVFDFNKHEELNEMRMDFDKPGNLFLIARLHDQDEVVGVLGLRFQAARARLRRWEPAVIPEFQGLNVAKDLLDQALKYLVSMGVKRISCLMKYPENLAESIAALHQLYKSLGFEQCRPDSIDMVMPLSDLVHYMEQPQGVKVETGEDYDFEDLASLVVNSFTSTPEEREIHGFDRTVTEHIQATALLQRMAEGFYGYSSSELRKVAVVDGIPVGFLSAFLSESKYKPLTGVIGPMAVLPGYRRQGIALLLIREVLGTLKDHSCEYAVTGTPAANKGAIALYEKAGFNLTCRIRSLEREL